VSLGSVSGVTSPAQTRPLPAARNATVETSGSAYTARHLLVLEGLEAVRKRPGMYIGSTDSRGLMHCVWEIIDNSVDEALGGFCTAIDVILHADDSVEVRDDGRGIPVDTEPRTGLSGVEVVMTKLHAGGKFGGGSYAATGGLHGVGASVVNALSARLDVEVDRDGATHRTSFQRGTSGSFAGEGLKGKFTAGGGLEKVRRVAKKVTGTRIRFWPDKQIFLAEAALSLPELQARARQTAFLVPGLTIRVTDARGRGEPSVDTYCFTGGITEFCDFLAPDAPLMDTLRLQGAETFTESVPVLDEAGHMTVSEVERELGVDIALRWGTGYDSTVRSFVNIIATPKGGTHVAGFERALVKTFGEVARAAKLLKTGEEALLKEDVLEGLTAIVTVRLAEPQFEGQTKEILGTNAATRIVARVVDRELRAFLTSTRRADKQIAKTVLEKVVAAARTRVAARQHKEHQRRKNALETSSLPAKLADCRSEDVDRSELFIVEGDSALGTAKMARNSEFQALLPIRGKILNVQKAGVGDVLKNAECASIIQVIGAGSGRTFDIDAARYGKIILMTDADVDGAHIRTLLLTLIHRYLRPLVDAGRVYAAMPPLHRIEVINAGKKANEILYTYTDGELRTLLADLGKKGRTWKDPQRYKGLGEMDAAQLKDTTMNPASRTLRRISPGDLEESEKVFDLLMGSDVAPRKEFIVNSAGTLDRSRIDA
jgi:DNA gyrase subunit B